MFIQHIRASDLFDCDQQAMNALVTAGAFVAVADGRVASSERDEVTNYICGQRLAPTVSRQQIADLFDERVQRVRERDFADIVVEALRPVATLSLTSNVIGIAERVAAADKSVHPEEKRVIRLLRLIMMTLPEPKVVGSSPDPVER
jgi:tellurite resistance protein